MSSSETGPDDIPGKAPTPHRMGRPLAMPVEARREKILEVALSVFAERGYQDATMDMIAQSAKMSKGSIYKLFASKHDVLEALLLSDISGYASQDRDDAAGADGPARLRAAIQSLIHYVFSRSQLTLTRMVICDGNVAPDLAALFHQKAMRPVVEVFAETIAALQREGVVIAGDPLVITDTIIGGVLGPTHVRLLVSGTPFVQQDDALLAQRTELITALFLSRPNAQNG